MLAAKEFVRSTLATHEKTRRLAELATDTLVEVVDACADRGVPLAGYAKGVTGFFKQEADDVLQAPYAHLKHDAGEQSALIQRLREQLRDVERELFETRARAHVQEQQLRDEEARSVELELALNEARARALALSQVPALEPDSPTRLTHSHSEPHTPSLQHAASTMTFGVPDADSPPPLELRGEDADEFLRAIGMDPDDADIFNKLRALDYSSDDDVPPDLVPAVYDPDATAVAPDTPAQPPKLVRAESSPLGIPHSGTFGFPGGSPESGRFDFGRAASTGMPESSTFGSASGIPESSTFGAGATSSAATTPADEVPRASGAPPAHVPSSSTAVSPPEEAPALASAADDDDEPPALTPALVHNPFGHSFASLPAVVEMLQLDRAPVPSAADEDKGNLAATLDRPLAVSALADPPRAVDAVADARGSGQDATLVAADTPDSPELGPTLTRETSPASDAVDCGVPAVASDDSSGPASAHSFGPASVHSSEPASGPDEPQTAPKLTLVSPTGASLHSESGPLASPSGVTHTADVDGDGDLDAHAQGGNPWSESASPPTAGRKAAHQHKPSTMTDGADTFASVMAVPPASIHTYPPSRATSIAESQSFAPQDSSGGHSFVANGVVHLDDSSASARHAAVRFPIENSSREEGVSAAPPVQGRARAKSVGGGGHKGRLAHMFEALERRLSIGRERERADSSSASASEASGKHHVAHRLHKPRSRANSAGATVLGTRSPAKSGADVAETRELSASTGAASEPRRAKSPRISIVSRFSSLRDVKTRGT